MPQLKDIMTHEVGDGDRLKIMTSYFTLYAFKEIRNELSKLGWGRPYHQSKQI